MKSNRREFLKGVLLAGVAIPLSSLPALAEPLEVSRWSQYDYHYLAMKYVWVMKKGDEYTSYGCLVDAAPGKGENWNSTAVRKYESKAYKYFGEIVCQ